VHPHESAAVVHQEEEVTVASRCRWIDGTAQISVYEPQLLIRSIVGLTWEQGSLVLPSEACVAAALDFIEQGQPVHHITTGEVTKSVEVHVSIPCVPTPRILATMHRETHWPCQLEVEDLEPAVATRHACKQPSVRVPQQELAMVNVGVEPDLVELP
jgi:hypothetical protein